MERAYDSDGHSANWVPPEEVPPEVSSLKEVAGPPLSPAPATLTGTALLVLLAGRLHPLAVLRVLGTKGGIVQLGMAPEPHSMIRVRRSTGSACEC